MRVKLGDTWIQLKRNYKFDDLGKETQDSLRHVGFEEGDDISEMVEDYTRGSHYEYSEEFKLVVAGCRDFHDYVIVEKALKKYLDEYGQNLTIISGNASGADELGEKFAKSNDLKLILHPADWKKFGRAAGPMRNEEMAKECDEVIVFWNGISRGTRSMINSAKKHNKPTQIISVRREK